MIAKDYQKQLLEALKSKFPTNEFVNEWVSFKRFKDHYSPKVDIAMGPFSVVSGQNKTLEYNRLIDSPIMHSFLKGVYDLHVYNVQAFAIQNELQIPEFETVLNRNQNARCFIALEIENANSKKHVMGSLINAASLGRIGIGIGYSQKSFRTFIRILNYLAFLKRVEKNTYDTTNFLVVHPAQLETLL